MARPPVACVLIVMLASGCSPSGSVSRKTAGVADVPTMTATLREQIPTGTSLAIAQDIMEREGFTCTVLRNSSFAGQEGTREGIDFLYCNRADAAFASSAKCRWQVALVLESDKVVDTSVSFGRIGP